MNSGARSAPGPRDPGARCGEGGRKVKEGPASSEPPTASAPLCASKSVELSAQSILKSGTTEHSFETSTSSPEDQKPCSGNAFKHSNYSIPRSKKRKRHIKK